VATPPDSNQRPPEPRAGADVQLRGAGQHQRRGISRYQARWLHRALVLGYHSAVIKNLRIESVSGRLAAMCSRSRAIDQEVAGGRNSDFVCLVDSVNQT